MNEERQLSRFWFGALESVLKISVIKFIKKNYWMKTSSFGLFFNKNMKYEHQLYNFIIFKFAIFLK